MHKKLDIVDFKVVVVEVEVGNRRIGEEEEEGITFMRQRLKGYVLYVLYSCL